MVEVIIGKPIVDAKELGFSEKSITTENRFLPSILVDLGLFKSNSEVRRNRPDLFIECNELGYHEFKIGKRHIYVLIGK